MSCSHPLKGFVIQPRAPDHAAEIKVCSYSTDRIYKMSKTSPWLPASGVMSGNEYRTISEFIEIPCGKCIECRLAYSRQWADRCMLELQDHTSSYFVTLTYDDDHLHVNDWMDSETGEFGTRSTLCKEDLQKFWKRLRKQCGNKIRYFACGEYGDQTLRPHYHAIVYGLQLDDLVFYKRTSQGFNLYESPTLEKIWSKGYVVVTDVTWDTCAYVSRYVMKKQKGQSATVYDKYNYVPEFTVMSRKPGIARNYYDKHKEHLYDTDYINIKTPSGGRQIRPSRYYDKLYDIDFPEKSFDMRERKKEFGEMASKLRLQHTDNSYVDMLKTQEIAKQEQIRILKRSAL